MHFYNALMHVLLFLHDTRATLLKDTVEEELARIEREHTLTKGNPLSNSDRLEAQQLMPPCG